MDAQRTSDRREEGGAGDTTGLGEPDLALLRTMIDVIPARVVVFDPEHRYRYVNREFLDFVGRPAGAVIGHHAVELLGDEAYAHYRPMTERVAAGETVRWEGWISYPKHGPRYVQEALTPYSPAETGFQGIVVFSRDLTPLKQRELELAQNLEALGASESLNRAVVSSALDCIVVIDEDGRVVEFNPAAEATFGYRRADVIGLPIGDLIVPPALRARHEEGFRRYRETGAGSVIGRRIEVEGMRADGSLLPVELAITEVKLPERRLFTAHLRDLTDERRAAAEIDAQRTRIHQIEKLSAMGSLLAGVAHELNNPLAILIAQATLLKEKAPTEDIRRRAERIHAAAERSGRIVKSFVSMARQKPPQREPTDINEVVRAALDMTAYGRRSAGIELDLSLDAKLPTISADRDLLGQVVANLLLNAHQALAEQPGARRIAVATRLQPQGVELAIADNGPGVPAEIAPRIFEPYFTTKPAGAGTGIGLSISRSVVESHGGRIVLDEQPGGGARFAILLPATGAAAADPEEARPRADSLSVLVVDDEIDVAQSLAEMLEQLGHRPQVADAAASALDAIDRHGFDVAFVDLRMPRVGGVDLRNQIGRRDPKLASRTIIVTGDTVAGPEAIARRSEHGEVVVLEKPFSVADVESAIRSVAQGAPAGTA
jgi:PAS domain S-box-containing protein